MHHTVLGCGCGLMSMVIQEFSSFSSLPCPVDFQKRKKIIFFLYRWSDVQISDQLSVSSMNLITTSQSQSGEFGSLQNWTVSSYSLCLKKNGLNIVDTKRGFRFAFTFWQHGTFLSLVSPPPLHPVAVLTWCTCNSLCVFSAEEEAALKGSSYIFQKLSCRC